MLIFSKYSFLFRKGEINFIYNARTNSFYKISDEAFNILSDIKHHGSINGDIDNSFLEALKDKKYLHPRKKTQNILIVWNFLIFPKHSAMKS